MNIYPWFTNINSYSYANRNDIYILQEKRESELQVISPSNQTNSTSEVQKLSCCKEYAKYKHGDIYT